MSENLSKQLGELPLWVKGVLLVGAFFVAYYGSYYFFRILG